LKKSNEESIKKAGLPETDTVRLAGAKRIGIMGGTFDPIHNGHLAAAESARAELRLDVVLFIPAGNPVFKQGKPLTPGALRFEMTRLATASNPAFHVSRIELDREGVTYTVDTLRALRSACPGTQLFFITGADAFADVLRWREASALFKLAAFVVAGRPGTDRKQLKEVIAKVRAMNGRIKMLDCPAVDISSSSLRGRAASGLPVRYLTPDNVAGFIEEHRLYLKERRNEHVPADEILKILRNTQSAKRFEHTKSVAVEARRLAALYGADEENAYLAGILHDAARGLPDDKLLSKARRYGVEINGVAAKRPSLIHGLVGAEMARHEFGVRNQDVLNAVMYHTTGRPGMSKLEKVVLVADYIEPTRPDREDVISVRAFAETDLDGAVIRALTEKIAFNRDNSLHPLSQQAYEYMVDTIKSEKEDT
jgi:nicotinate-nucleotide adenylyltransferase